MRTIQLLAVILSLFIFQSNLSAQSQPIKKNYVKLNLTGIPLGNYGVQVEHAMNRKISLALSGRVMPERGLPFKSKLLDAIEDDNQSSRDIIEGVKLSNYALTPEVKFYLGKGYGQGFYVSLFYRYAHFGLKEIPVNFDLDGGGKETINISGNLNGHSGGFLLGWQKTFANILTLDLWFIGPHKGTSSSSLSGTSAHTLSPAEQDEVRSALEDIDIPLFKVKAEVNSNSAKVKMDGPWLGIRSGITLGVRF